jgi:hypothetical protein
MIVILFLILTALLFGLGFAVKILWYFALAMLIIWVLGFAVRSTDARWYRW